MWKAIPLCCLLLATARSVPADELQLPDVHGKRHALILPDSRLTVVVFLGTECPIVKLSTKTLNRLTRRFAKQNVRFVGVMSNVQDSLLDVSTFSKRHGIGFPLLRDERNRIADHFSATRTPEVILLDQKKQILYRGRIDDQFDPGVARGKPGKTFLTDAIVAALAGKKVALKKTKAVGCLIGRAKKPVAGAKVTYSNQISRILQKHCVECHRAGEIAPFALTDYKEVYGWAEMIAEVVAENRMPPWHAAPGHFAFRNARRLTSDERKLIREWVKSGAPEGDRKQLPAARKFVSGWRLPQEPDRVIAMRKKPFRVPAEGVVEYQYFAVDPGFKKDVWVKAAELIPGNRRVVHHAIVFISPPRASRRRGIGWLTAYVPGQQPMILGDGMARLIPRGSKLIFQMHYTPVGTPQEDNTQLGLVFAEESDVKERVITLMTANPKFEIPPGARNYEVTANLKWFPRGAKLLAIAPHMHLRGRTFTCRSIDKSGKKTTLLEVPRYDFNWQTAYEFETPIDCKDLKGLESVGGFDNSDANPFNPDPKATVRWGDQTFEEMMVSFFEFSIPRDPPKVVAKPKATKPPPVDPKKQAKAEARAKQLFAKFDANENGRLERGEMPQAFQRFGFYRYDRNRDDVLTRDELIRGLLAR